MWETRHNPLSPCLRQLHNIHTSAREALQRYIQNTMRFRLFVPRADYTPELDPFAPRDEITPTHLQHKMYKSDTHSGTHLITRASPVGTSLQNSLISASHDWRMGNWKSMFWEKRTCGRRRGGGGAGCGEEARKGMSKGRGGKISRGRG